MSFVSSYVWLCTSDTSGHCAKDGLSMFAIDESKPIQSLADIYGGRGASAQIMLFEFHNCVRWRIKVLLFPEDNIWLTAGQRVNI